MTDFVDVAAIDELSAGGQKSVTVGAMRVLLCRDATTGQVCAIRDLCPHAFQSLAGGAVRDGWIQCPAHGARFDLVTGRSLNDVTPRPAQIHTVQIADGRILVSPTPSIAKTA